MSVLTGLSHPATAVEVPTVTVPVVLSPALVCELVPGMTERTLSEMRSRRNAGETDAAKAGPPYSKAHSKAVVYLADEVIAWLGALKK